MLVGIAEHHVDITHDATLVFLAAPQIWGVYADGAAGCQPARPCSLVAAAEFQVCVNWTSTKTYMKRIYAKLGISSQTELFNQFIRHLLADK